MKFIILSSREQYRIECIQLYEKEKDFNYRHTTIIDSLHVIISKQKWDE